MNRYAKEIILIAAQTALFYLFPPFAIADPIGMVLLILIGTFVLSLLMGILSGTGLKWLFPPLTALIFLPTVFLYYNESAMIHAAWYLVISSIGLLTGSLIRKLCVKK